MSSIDQVLAAARALEESGKEPTLALIKSRLGTSLPMPILIQGLQKFKSMPKAERERLTDLPESEININALHAKAPTLASIAAQLTQQQTYFEQAIGQKNAEIMQLKNELLDLKQRLSLLESQGKPA